MSVNVRIIRNQIYNFKNVEYGNVEYMSYDGLSSKKIPEIKERDVIGLYGQNGSGKTAVVEVLDIIRSVIAGEEVDYSTYGGVIDSSSGSRIITDFLIQEEEKLYRVEYDFTLIADKTSGKVQLHSERVGIHARGKQWLQQKFIKLSNPYYQQGAILSEVYPDAVKHKLRFLENMDVLKSVAMYSAQSHSSIFFNSVILGKIESGSWEQIDEEFASLIKGIRDFGRMSMHVVKVNQLAEINRSNVIPMNLHCDYGEAIVHGCLPIFTTGKGVVPSPIFEQLILVIKAVNTAIKSLIPGLELELRKLGIELQKDGSEYVQIEMYSKRYGKEFLTKYESEGIKRIISLLQYLIAAYNSSEVCLVIDELDAGIYEHLLGEFLGFFFEGAKGQLIFTSHNLRVLEKLPMKNIVCTTTNPMNRYITLSGVHNHNNRRDFYLRALTVGGQSEELYDDVDLDSMEYAFYKAHNKDTDKRINFWNIP